MSIPAIQASTLRWLDEYIFVTAFMLMNIINKHELCGDWSASPTSYQGWQLFFSFIIFNCLLIHPRIRAEVKILNKANLVLMLPICMGYCLSITAGTVALSKLPIPVFLAWSNLCPAVLALFGRGGKKLGSHVTMSSVVVCITIVIIFVINGTEENQLFYFCATVYSVINFSNFLYIKRINLQIPDITLIFHTNLIGFFTLFPFSAYNAPQTHPGLNQISPCLFTGIFNLAIQIFSFRIKSKDSRFLVVHAVAQLITVVMSLYLFEEDIDKRVWALIIINWFFTGFVLCPKEDTNENGKFILVVPQMTNDMYIEKYINYNMA